MVARTSHDAYQLVYLRVLDRVTNGCADSFNKNFNHMRADRAPVNEILARKVELAAAHNHLKKHTHASMLIGIPTHIREMAGIMDSGTLNTNEETSFGIIASSGATRSLAFEALEEAKQGHFDKAKELLHQADEMSLEAHNIQTALLTKEAQGDHTPVDVLLVHAQDHLMTSILAKELIEQMIELYKRLDARA